jgi:hypothetical protein
MLTPYLRGATWWVKGRVEYNGRPISAYLRESTGASDEAGARDWIVAREDQERRRHLIGEEEQPLTFAAAVMMYQPTPMMARYLKPLLRELGPMRCDRITAGMIRDLGPKLYPAPVRTLAAVGRHPCPRRHQQRQRQGQMPADQDQGLQRAGAGRAGQEAQAGEPTGAPPRRLGMAAQLPPQGSAAARRAGAVHVRDRRPRRPVRPDDAEASQARRGQGHHPRREGPRRPRDSDPARIGRRAGEPEGRRFRGDGRGRGEQARVRLRVELRPAQGVAAACKEAKIPYLSPHAAGRHGFGQEHVIRQGSDSKAVGKFGGWSDTVLLARTYTHAEDFEDKILAGFRTGLVQAESETGLKLLKTGTIIWNAINALRRQRPQVRILSGAPPSLVETCRNVRRTNRHCAYKSRTSHG